MSELSFSEFAAKPRELLVSLALRVLSSGVQGLLLGAILVGSSLQLVSLAHAGLVWHRIGGGKPE